jgi:hypothetical protein
MASVSPPLTRKYSTLTFGSDRRKAKPQKSSPKFPESLSMKIGTASVAPVPAPPTAVAA